jgi:MraZ protein
MAVHDFAGEYLCSMDSKNRVNIPSSIRKLIVPEAANTLVFTRGFEEQNLYAYPLNEWERLTKKLRTLNPLNKDTRDFIRLFVGVAFHATMDTQGRIMIPERILKMGKIDRELQIIGSLTKLEIWSPEVYGKYLKTEDLNLSDLAQKMSFTDMFFDEG